MYKCTPTVQNTVILSLRYYSNHQIFTKYIDTDKSDGYQLFTRLHVVRLLEEAGDKSR